MRLLNYVKTVVFDKSNLMIKWISWTSSFTQQLISPWHATFIPETMVSKNCILLTHFWWPLLCFDQKWRKSSLHVCLVSNLDLFNLPAWGGSLNWKGFGLSGVLRKIVLAERFSQKLGKKSANERLTVCYYFSESILSIFLHTSCCGSPRNCQVKNSGSCCKKHD